MTLEAFFDGYEASRPIFDALQQTIVAIGPAAMRVTKSQIAFRRRVAFAWAWIPDQYLRGGHAPLVLSLSFRHRDPSPRWKQVVEPYPGRFIHHLELYAAEEIDEEVEGWVMAAWAVAR
jgi:hypothetical protein